eukprot:12403395-Alexandrium_andersonii.AAC.1
MPEHAAHWATRGNPRVCALLQRLELQTFASATDLTHAKLSPVQHRAQVLRNLQDLGDHGLAHRWLCLGHGAA